MRTLDIFELEPADLENVRPSAQAILRQVTARLVKGHLSGVDALHLETTPASREALVPGVPIEYRNDLVTPMVESRRTTCLGVTLFVVRACLARSVDRGKDSEHTEAYQLDYVYDPEPDLAAGEQAITLNNGCLAVWSGFTDGHPTSWQDPSTEQLTGDYLAHSLATALRPLLSRNHMPDGVSWAAMPLTAARA
jgi:hypothetical protein